LHHQPAKFLATCNIQTCKIPNLQNSNLQNSQPAKFQPAKFPTCEIPTCNLRFVPAALNLNERKETLPGRKIHRNFVIFVQKSTLT
jgi:hypothetical protein